MAALGGHGRSKYYPTNRLKLTDFLLASIYIFRQLLANTCTLHMKFFLDHFGLTRSLVTCRENVVPVKSNVDAYMLQLGLQI